MPPVQTVSMLGQIVHLAGWLADPGFSCGVDRVGRKGSSGEVAIGTVHQYMHITTTKVPGHLHEMDSAIRGKSGI